MATNIKIQKLLNKNHSSIISTIESSTFKYTDAELFFKLENLMQEAYELGRIDALSEMNKN